MTEDKIRVFYIGEGGAPKDSLDYIKTYLHAPEDINSRLVIDAENPEYVFVMPFIYSLSDLFNEFKKYYRAAGSDARVFIFLSGEAVEPDLNIFDYAITCYSLISEHDRIFRMPPNLFWINAKNYINTFTYQDALNKVKNNNLKFCNFIYSNPNAHPVRDQLFYKLSEYKRVDSLGPHLNNVNTQGSRSKSNWYDLSVELKSNYKFSIASENAVFNGYTSEKLLSSFQAHTVPIYFGNPKVKDEYNPEAFINVNDYKDLDALLKRIKEIDEDDDLWARIVSAPWQTEAQRCNFEAELKSYHEFLRKLFDPQKNIKEKIQRAFGTYARQYRLWFFERKTISLFELKLRQFAQKILKSLGLLEYYHALKKKFKY